MKWSFVIQQKLKAAMLLGGIMALIVGGTVLSRYNVEGIDRSFSSIYRDRLIPATTIIYLTENLYRKRLSLENYSFRIPEPPSRIKAQLRAYDRSIDSLVRLFEKTYLVDEEAKSLNVLKTQIRKYTHLQESGIELVCIRFFYRCQAGLFCRRGSSF